MHPPNLADQMRPEAGIMRPARAACAALVCTVLAAGAHAAAGGRASSASLVAVFLGTWVVTAAIAGRRLTTSQLVGLLMVGQAVTHVVSTPTAGHDTTMLAAHVLGTAASALLLRRGEDALWTLAERIALRASGVTAGVSSLAWRPSAVLATSSRTHRPLLLTHVIDERGPPTGRA